MAKGRGSIIRAALGFLHKSRRRPRGTTTDPRLHSRGRPRGQLPGPRLSPIKPETAYAVGRRYGVDLAGVPIHVRDRAVGYFGFTNSRQQIVLARNAFSNEQEMARTLYHERYHVGQLGPERLIRALRPRFWPWNGTRMRPSNDGGTATR
ncbi:hypothetical protein [Asanoa iriomotensis]|uniref:DUF4157 domain-containing protein n=1 Tax=Asanoa iriomotensis TaxID=234613 RepID=A0ABQ4BVK2_9ACTN|nr:hypothetical protein [Asanoa iriomotensis]GIF54558.1 hypothetical protein Air01nite_06530 [Asanoa iriomotensis]